MEKSVQREPPLTSQACLFRFILVLILLFGSSVFICCQSLYARNNSIAESFSNFYFGLFNGVRTRSYEMNSRSNLLYLLETGIINRNILA